MLRITAWHEDHENNRTRELKRLDWVPVPNKMDGDGYTSLVDHEEGAAHLGAWLAILEIASRCEHRGILVRSDGKPHDAKSLSRMSRLPMPIFETVIPRLIEIGWLTQFDDSQLDMILSQDTAGIPQDDATSPQDDPGIPQDAASSRVRARARQRAPAQGREGKGMEGKGGTRACAHETPPGATAPEPPPPLSASPLPEPEPEVWDDEPPIDAEGVLHAWGVQAKLRNRIPGPMTPKEAAQIATACPDAPRLRDAMTIAFLSESPPASNFFTKDLGKWVSLGDEYRRRMDRGDVSPPDAAREVLAAKKKRGA